MVKVGDTAPEQTVGSTTAKLTAPEGVKAIAPKLLSRVVCVGDRPIKAILDT